MRIKSSANSLPGYFEKYGYSNISKERLEAELDRYRSLGKDQKTLDFIAKFLLVYGLDDPERQISFENTEYINSYNKIFFICKKHGVASSYPFRMLCQGKKCGKCGHEFKKQLPPDESYLKNFKFSMDKLDKVIEKAGFVKIDPAKFYELITHYERLGLSDKSLRFLVQFFLRCGENQQFSFDKFIFTDSSKTSTVICKKHGDFEITPQSLLSGGSCPECFYESLRFPYSSIPKRPEFEYDDEWNEANWHGIYNSKIRIKCKKHGWFIQGAAKHFFRKDNCPRCSGSRMEKELTEKLMSLGFKMNEDFIREKTFPGFVSQLGHPFRFDFFFPKKNLLIELDGILHFELRGQSEEEFERLKKADQLKEEFAVKNGLKLLRIHYDEFDGWMKNFDFNSLSVDYDHR